jgi:hypothetical protein
MNITATSPISAPSGFKIDADNPHLYWGPKVEAEDYYLHLTWNALDGKLELYSEVGDYLPATSALNLAVDLALMAQRIRALTPEA